MLPGTDGYFKEIAERLAPEYPDIEFETFIIDDFACRLITQPQHFDVVVMPNLYGDIMSDAAAGLVGSLGMAASGCFGTDYAYFEPAHGTAPDIAGQGIINPTAALFTAAMMLDYLDLEEPAERLMSALRQTYAQGSVLTPDQGGTGTTEAFCAAVRRYLGL
jgi:isocitrate/isopropylmalate dehydrogenase